MVARTPRRPAAPARPSNRSYAQTLTSNATHEPATRPEDLGRFFIERANAGDVEGLVALYEPDAVLAFPPGQLTTGTQAIRKVYEQLLATNPSFQGTPQPAIVNGDLALTSTRIPSGATVEIARRQPDGTWRWLVDQPRILS